ncbi:MAG: hypothetical protein HRT50_16370, partial [Colwellia sp.]|nr:hypothetical protein [Colwellia sp.]
DETSFIQAADTQTKPTSLEDKAQLAERVIELEQQVAALTEQMARLTELLDSE